MEQSFTHLEIFERYYEGRMTDKETEDFEAGLEQDAALKNEFEQFTILMKGIELHGEAQIRQTLGNVQKKLEKENFLPSTEKHKIIPMQTNFNSKRIILLAAAALVVILLGIWFFYPKSPGPQEVFARYYHPDTETTAKILDKLESRGFAAPADPRSDSLLIIIKAYESYEYDKALYLLNQFLVSHPGDKIGAMYLGLTLLQRSEYAKAAQHLGPLAREDDFEHHNTCRWYLALCLSQFDDKNSMEEAKSWLKKLAGDPDSGYQKEAKGMLSLL